MKYYDFFLVRYEQSHLISYGEVVDSFASPNANMTVTEYKSINPELFSRPGVYALLKSDGNTLTVSEDEL